MNFMANQQYRSQTTIQATESKDNATQERQTHCVHKIVRSMGYSTDVPRCVHCGATEKEAQELTEQYLAKAYSESLYGQLANAQKPGSAQCPSMEGDFETASIRYKARYSAPATSAKAAYYGDHHDNTDEFPKPWRSG